MLRVIFSSCVGLAAILLSTDAGGDLRADEAPAAVQSSDAAPNVENWPGWRGPRGDGTSRETAAPTAWDGTIGKGVVWKTEIPGGGHSSPIVWGDRVFVATCLDETSERALVCLNRATGKILWQQVVLAAPLEKKHTLNSFASGTPATDGKLVYVTFLEPDFASEKERTPGDMVVAAYDFAGRQQWVVRPGRFASTHGYCSSPVLFESDATGPCLVINGDHDGDGYLVALARVDGREIWRAARPNNTRSYCTPIIRDLAGRTQLLLSGSKCVASYDPRTGREHWRMDGPTEQFVASLVDDGQYVYLTAGFPERHVLAINPDGRGPVGDDKIVWRTRKNCSYVPSPVVCDGYLFVAADDGIATCYHAASGKLQWTRRLGKHYSASLAAAGGLVYFLADDGITQVVRPGSQCEVVAENRLGEYCYASPAISQGQLFIRGEKHLFCIGR